MKIRTGIGIDVHRFEKNREFWLGGVKINHHSGLTGHSDADALIHAIIDAMLGAAGLKDIGTYFPDNDPGFHNIRSTKLLEEVVNIVNQNYRIGNIDAVICLEQPKISPYIDEMKQVLSKVLMIPSEDLSIKATTFEMMGFVGKEEGVLCLANVLLTGKHN